MGEYAGHLRELVEQHSGYALSLPDYDTGAGHSQLHGANALYVNIQGPTDEVFS